MSDDEKSAIRDQLNRLLLDSQFRNSRRYPSFLRYVVDHTLDGNTDSLKERVIGVEVFGRPADYDSTQDPIVRVTAAEIRKRIARYYLDPAHKGEIRLVLPTGTYVPVFEPTEPLTPSRGIIAPSQMVTLTARPLAVETNVLRPASVEEVDPESTNPSRSAFVKKGLISPLLWVAIGIVVITAVTYIALWRVHQPSMVETFWGPIWNSKKPLLFCIADQSGYHDPSSPLNQPIQRTPSPAASPTLVAAEDTVPLVDFVTQIRGKGQTYRIQVQAQTNFNDFNQGPATLIGALSNQWTLFFISPLRFHFATDAGLQHLWVADREHPDNRDWMVRSGLSEQGQRTDYAIVARFINAKTQQPTVIVAGLGHDGTAAAGNFVLSEECLSQLEKREPRVRTSQNLEVVLETLVVNGHSGPPRIDAVAIW